MGILIFPVLLLLLSIPSEAHPPANVSLSYDQNNQTLNVTIMHTVSAPAGHYIARVEVTKNDQAVLSQNYTSQPSSYPFTYSYPVNATSGDVLKATATCSIRGSKPAEITVV